MPWLGAHMSVAGGYHKAVAAAERLGMEAVQIFTHSPSQWVVTRQGAKKPGPGPQALPLRDGWSARPIAPAAVAAFVEACGRSHLKRVLAHDSYLINVASPDVPLRRRSIEALVVEVKRAEELRLAAVVMHPGAALDARVEDGILRIAEALDEVYDRCGGPRVRVLLETTAGQGSSIGHRFEHLAAILQRVRHPEWLGVCLDTCHVFAAGYPLAPATAYRRTLRQFDDLIGLHRLEAFHLNDSARPLGSRVDRHAHIGQGELGLEPFRLLLNDRRFRQHPMILETPKGGQDLRWDAINLATLRSLLQDC
jgi:deoxyribonuclease-4